MGIFNRRKKASTDEPDVEDTTEQDTTDDGATGTVDDTTGEDAASVEDAPSGGAEDSAGEQEPGPAPKAGPRDRAENGPFDVSEVDDDVARVDLGALHIPATTGMQLRLDMDESSNRVVSVTILLDGSTLQLQAFAAPRSEGLWEDIRTQIVASISRQGGTADQLHTAFGPEIIARIPARTADNRTGVRQARFVGVDGPRWFLRAVVGGTALNDHEARETIEDLLRKVVVVRGDAPLPPRDLLPIEAPKGSAPADEAAEDDGLPNPFERGPEITEIR